MASGLVCERTQLRRMCSVSTALGGSPGCLLVGPGPFERRRQHGHRRRRRRAAPFPLGAVGLRATAASSGARRGASPPALGALT